jgi:nucleotide-binding universal stress UspA family protein
MANAGPQARYEIVFGTDFSLCSERAKEIAVQYARRLDGRLHVVHVAGWLHTRDCRTLLEREVEAVVGIPVVGHHTSGSAPVELARYAFDVGAMLIVVGTHGRSGVSHAILGSTAERVLRLAHCPVLVVPPLASPNVRPAPESHPALAARPCLVCSGETEELICEGCRSRIRGEAIVRRQEEVHSGRS